jgi:hypothetical protein
LSAETNGERESRAEELAYRRGRREQEVDSRFEAGDKRFAAINGSIERSALAQEETNRELGGVKQALADVVRKLDTGEAVSAALAKATVSRREFWLGVAAVVATLAGALIASGGHI